MKENVHLLVSQNNRVDINTEKAEYRVESAEYGLENAEGMVEHYIE